MNDEISPKKKWIKRSLWALLALAILVPGIWFWRVAATFTKDGSVKDLWNGMTNPRALFPGKDRIIILVLGKDYNHDKKSMPYSTDARADTIMLISADLANKRLAAVSIPRDTQVFTAEGKPTKINSLFQKGGSEGLRTSLQEQFGVFADYVVVLKDTAVKEIVDSVGGVDVEALDDMVYDDSWAGLHINIRKGKQHISGDQAVGFVRFRKMGTHRVDEQGRKIPIPRRTSIEEGDIRRTQRQQELLHALVHQALSPGNIVNATGIINTGFSQVETDLTRTQILALARLFQDQASGKMTTAVLPGTDATEEGIYYYKPDMARSELTLDWILRGDEAAGRSLVRVVVYNTSPVKGAAQDVAAMVRELTFTPIIGGAYKEKLPVSEVVYRKAAHEDFARELATKLGINEVRKDTGDPRADWRPEIKVVLGADYQPKAR